MSDDKLYVVVTWEYGYGDNIDMLEVKGPPTDFESASIYADKLETASIHADVVSISFSWKMETLKMPQLIADSVALGRGMSLQSVRVRPAAPIQE